MVLGHRTQASQNLLEKKKTLNHTENVFWENNSSKLAKVTQKELLYLKTLLTGVLYLY